MATELELKFPQIDPSLAGLALATAGAKRLGVARQIDRYFDTPDRSLLAGDRGIRVRSVDGEPDILTYKGPRAADAQAKIREELESTCTPAGSVAPILTALGMVELVTVAKTRTEYELAGCVIALDEVDRLGTFLEIEGPTQAAITAAAKQLNLEDHPTTTNSYAQLLAELGE
jgi:adenylate cyclase class 2